jgi:hypothetical protein
MKVLTTRHTTVTDPLVTEVGDLTVVTYLVDDMDPMNENPFTESGEFEWDSVSNGWGSISPLADNMAEELSETDWERKCEQICAYTDREGEPLAESNYQADCLYKIPVNDDWTDEEIFHQFKMAFPGHYRYAFWIPEGGSQSYCDLLDTNDLSRAKYVLSVPRRCVEGMEIEEVDAMVEAYQAEYLAWARGEVYGICTEVFDAHGERSEYCDPSETVWGYIGWDYAEQSAKEDHDSTVKMIKDRVLAEDEED